MSEDRKIFHQLLDRYLDEPETVQREGSRLIQYVKAEVLFDDLGRPSNRIRETRYRLIVKTEIQVEER